MCIHLRGGGNGNTRRRRRPAGQVLPYLLSVAHMGGSRVAEAEEGRERGEALGGKYEPEERWTILALDN